MKKKYRNIELSLREFARPEKRLLGKIAFLRTLKDKSILKDVAKRNIKKHEASRINSREVEAGCPFFKSHDYLYFRRQKEPSFLFDYSQDEDGFEKEYLDDLMDKGLEYKMDLNEIKRGYEKPIIDLNSEWEEACKKIIDKERSISILMIDAFQEEILKPAKWISVSLAREIIRINQHYSALDGHHLKKMALAASSAEVGL